MFFPTTRAEWGIYVVCAFAAVGFMTTVGYIVREAVRLIG